MNKLGEYLKKYGVRIGILVLAVLLLSLLASTRSDNGVTAAENGAVSLTLPVKKASTGLIGWLEGIYGYMFRYDELAKENEELTIRVTELENQLREAKQTELENKELKSLLGLRSKSKDFVYEMATIIDRGSSNWNSTLTIDKGEEMGIQVGSCVVDSSHNLVGQVIEVGAGWSTVRTVIDTDMKVGALVGEGGSAAMIVGDFALMRQGLTKLSYLTEEAQVFVDDVLLTSGKGGSFPRGIVIGTVKEILTEAGGQIEYATVTPAGDPDKLTRVFVIKSFTVVE